MPMSSAGRAGSSSGCVTKPKERETGLSGFAVPIQVYSLIGSYVMATAEHREPYESRGSRTCLGARGGEIPPRDSTIARIYRVAPLLSASPQLAESVRAAKCFRVVPTCGLVHRKKEHHSKISSARPDNGSGMVMPSARAVFKLMYISTFVACCTGRSAGLSPLRIRPA